MRLQCGAVKRHLAPLRNIAALLTRFLSCVPQAAPWLFSSSFEPARLTACNHCKLPKDSSEFKLRGSIFLPCLQAAHEAKLEKLKRRNNDENNTEFH